MGEVEGEGWAEIIIEKLDKDEYKKLLKAMLNQHGTVTISTYVGMDIEPMEYE